ncbi:MAG: hypothetical protein WBA74_03650 [Cyclobacteriaceae bacterium]
MNDIRKAAVNVATAPVKTPINVAKKLFGIFKKKNPKESVDKKAIRPVRRIVSSPAAMPVTRTPAKNIVATRKSPTVIISRNPSRPPTNPGKITSNLLQPVSKATPIIGNGNTYAEKVAKLRAAVAERKRIAREMELRKKAASLKPANARLSTMKGSVTSDNLTQHKIANAAIQNEMKTKQEVLKARGLEKKVEQESLKARQIETTIEKQEAEVKRTKKQNQLMGWTKYAIGGGILVGAYLLFTRVVSRDYPQLQRFQPIQ